MTTRLPILICAGETSGDALAAVAMRELTEIARRAAVRIDWLGMGGSQMRALAGKGMLDLADVQTAGLVELLPRVPRIVARYRRLLDCARKQKPALAILVDFPDFNLRLAHALKQEGVPVLYYVAPQVWAWRENRLDAIRRDIDRLAVIFPFEKTWFAARGKSAVYVGHPLVAQIAPQPEPKTPRLLLCPGSRKHEIEAILPVQLDALQGWRQSGDAPEAAVLVATGRGRQIARIIARRDMALPTGRIEHPWSLAWCAAGTVSLQLALANIPWILTHRVNVLSYRMARLRIQTPYLGMPNILLGRKAAPELVQDALRPQSLLSASRELMRDRARRFAIKNDWARCRDLLETPLRDTSVAELAWEMLEDI